MNRSRFSEETVLSVSKTTLAGAREHVEALSDFGITAEALDRFDTEIQAAEALPVEIQNRIELRELTHVKIGKGSRHPLHDQY